MLSENIIRLEDTINGLSETIDNITSNMLFIYNTKTDIFNFIISHEKTAKINLITNYFRNFPLPKGYDAQFDITFHKLLDGHSWSGSGDQFNLEFINPYFESLWKYYGDNISTENHLPSLRLQQRVNNMIKVEGSVLFYPILPMDVSHVGLHFIARENPFEYSEMKFLEGYLKAEKHVFNTVYLLEESKKYGEEMFKFSQYDPLTSTLRKEIFFLMVTKEMQNMLRYNKEENYSAFYFIDLDYFKEINDTYGHHIGDLALKTFADHINDSLRGSDLIARYAGDEFIIYTPSLVSKNEAESLCNRLNKNVYLSENSLIASISIECSIGVNIFNIFNDFAKKRVHDDELRKYIKSKVEFADEAMYRAKKTRCGYSF